jgi:hypothetical protein
MIPEDFSTDLDAFLDWPVTDESAWLIAELLRQMAQCWENNHFSQIRRYLHDNRPPPKDPQAPWR